MSDLTPPLAHNTERSGPKQDVPVIIEHPEHYVFADGERERQWHTASDDELIAYETYWNKVHDAGDEDTKPAPDEIVIVGPDDVKGVQRAYPDLHEHAAGVSKFDTHTYEVRDYDLEGPSNRAGEIVATRKSDGATLIVRLYSNGDGGIVLHVIAEGTTQNVIVQNETGSDFID